MLCSDTKIKGAYVIDPERFPDHRGFFARAWDRRDLEKKGLSTALAQCNISYNKSAGTLRGMHYQLPPHAEIKVVRCTMGALYDVIVDLRKDSPSYRQWAGVELTAENRRMLYIPEGCAHGFITLVENTEAYYHVSAHYEPSAYRGVRYNDPAFGIEWPREVSVIAERDATYPDYKG